LGGRSLREKIMDLLEFVDLKEFTFKRVRYFSDGMRRRLEIAEVLCMNPNRSY